MTLHHIARLTEEILLSLWLWRFAATTPDFGFLDKPLPGPGLLGWQGIEGGFGLVV
jgi:hypothetical protein